MNVNELHAANQRDWAEWDRRVAEERRVESVRVEIEASNQAGCLFGLVVFAATVLLLVLLLAH